MLASEIWCPPLPALSEGGLARPRIGIGGMSIEASTFSPYVSGEADFTVRRGDGLLGYYPFLVEGRDLYEAAEWVPLVHARSLPGGIVDRDFYESVKAELLERAAAAHAEQPFDGFFFHIHGAMSVQGMDDAEGDLGTALREVLGPDVLVSTSMDLHGNVSKALLDASDLITCYRMAPHEDAPNTVERAVYNLLLRLRAATGADSAARRPWKAWRQVPVLLPGEKTSTRLEPAASIYSRVAEIADAPEILDAAVWVGYAWADEPRCQAAVVVTSDDRVAAEAACAELARAYWQARDGFVFVADARPLDEALEVALADDAPRPFVISDSGDNPTAGGAGDATWTLSQLAADPRITGGGLRTVHASVFDPEAVATAAAAGVGAEVDLTVGGRVEDPIHGPTTLRGEVFSVTDGDPTAGRQVVLRVGGLHAILTERRKPFHHLDDFRILGIEPTEFDLVLVKIGYLEPELYDLAEGWILGLTPGGVDQDLVRLGHHRLQPGVFPFEDATDPDLTVWSGRR